MKKEGFFSATRISVIAVFAALSGVLYLFGIPMPLIFAPWLELNFSDIPMLIGSFALGPASGAIIIIFKIIIKLIIKGTSTVFVGELADLVIGLAFVLPSGIIYNRRKTLKNAILAMVIGSLCSTAVSVISNRFMLIPFYVNVMHWDMAGLASMLSGLYKDITVENFYTYYLLLSVVPFNLMRCIIASLVTALVYKRISKLIKRMNVKFSTSLPENATEEERAAYNKKNTITVIVFSAVTLLLIGGVILRYMLA